MSVSNRVSHLSDGTVQGRLRSRALGAKQSIHGGCWCSRGAKEVIAVLDTAQESTDWSKRR